MWDNYELMCLSAEGCSVADLQTKWKSDCVSRYGAMRKLSLSVLSDQLRDSPALFHLPKYRVTSRMSCCHHMCGNRIRFWVKCITSNHYKLRKLIMFLLPFKLPSLSGTTKEELAKRQLAKAQMMKEQLCEQQAILEKNQQLQMEHQAKLVAQQQELAAQQQQVSVTI
jgi:hypothetical protein